jgi:hypothetical protein
MSIGHPRYGPNDPKSGAPVLIGDMFWYRYLADGDVKGPLRADSFNAKYIVDVSGVCPHSISTDGYQFFSAPPAPNIEACACGHAIGTLPQYPVGAGNFQVQCAACGRCGPMSNNSSGSISLWNADQRKLKQ